VKSGRKKHGFHRLLDVILERGTNSRTFIFRFFFVTVLACVLLFSAHKAGKVSNSLVEEAENVVVAIIR